MCFSLQGSVRHYITFIVVGGDSTGDRIHFQDVVNADELGLVLWCLLSHYQVWRKIFDLRERFQQFGNHYWVMFQAFADLKVSPRKLGVVNGIGMKFAPAIRSKLGA
ncbi:hypothetical protein M758_9G092700 [Ceratodon purpureus]|nr:hypothetical protein M758_9G092700 [Ceratodon purpureus]